MNKKKGTIKISQLKFWVLIMKHLLLCPQTEYERHRRLARVSRLQRGVAAAEGDCDEDEDRPHQRGGGRHLLDSDDLSGGHLSDEGDEAIAEQQSSAEFIQLRTGEGERKAHLFSI